jgi:hypothetical protein
MKSLIEQLRSEAVGDLFPLKGFGTQWKLRQKFFLEKLGGSKKKSDIIKLGDCLSVAFKLTGSEDRSQGSLSSAGSTWEALVVWYLNLCLVGTRAVCVRGAPLSPAPIRDALSVCFENSVLRSEPDVILISSEALAKAPAVANRKEMLAKANEVIEESFEKTGLINFQCKTNWNDNAQIPMLWNMLYNQSRKGALIPNGFSIGRNGYSLKNLGFFGYSFVTVPTQKKGPQGYKAENLDVMRVKTMSAGNYWGHPSRNGVCMSLAEFFNFFNRSSAVFPNVSDVGKVAAAWLNTGTQDAAEISMFRLGENS